MKSAGRFLGVNLFEWFVPTKAADTHLTAQLKAKQDELDAKEKELNELKQKNGMLELENKYLKELVEMAKMKLKH
jgi:cell division protein FtsB